MLRFFDSVSLMKLVYVLISGIFSSWDVKAFGVCY